MKRISLCFIALLVYGSSYAQQLKDDSTKSAPLLSIKDAIEHLKKDIPELMQKADVPGMSVALVRDGKMVWSGVYGVMSNDTKKPVTHETIFEANSLSKPMFSYAVMTLVDQGKFDLDKPIVNYVDSAYFAKACDDPRLKNITIRMILSNSSGIAYLKEDKFAIEFTPGEKFKYSPTGFQVLSHLIERVTGTKVEDLVQQAILTPLGMTQSSFIWQDRYDSLRAYQHDWQGKTDTNLRKWKRGAACCSLQTNAEDYSKFVIAVMNGKLLKKKTWNEVMKPQVNVDARFPNLFWGLGWGLEKTKTGESFWHWGDGGKSKDYIKASLSSKDAVIFFANSENGLSYGREILDDGMGGVHLGLLYLDYQRYDSPAAVMLKAILTNGASAALSDGKPSIGEVPMNAIGYQLVSIKKLDDAVVVFKKNTVDFPQSWNTWDSLAEACMDNGDKESAIKYYKKSLELNPKNTGAVEQLKKLE